MSRGANITGQRFGKLVAIRQAYKNQWNAWMWLCECDCGNTKTILLRSLRLGDTKSCGCIKVEENVSRATHGQSHNFNSTYAKWRSMRERCNNPNCKDYPNYGGRGIKVCRRWNDYGLFESDMGPKPTPEHTIERKDNDGDYEPENCVWATRLEQRHNQRKPVSVTSKLLATL